jgi:hypothetical protein
MRWIVVAVGLALCLGCPKPPELPSPAPETVFEPDPSWVRDFPANLTQVRLHGSSDCVFVTGIGTDEVRVQMCVDPRTAETRWTHQITGAGGPHAVDDYAILGDKLLYASHRELLCLGADGRVAWRYKGGKGRALYATFVAEDVVVVSVGNEELAVIGKDDGVVRNTIPLEDDALKALVRTADATIAIVVEVEAGGGAAVVGLDVASGARVWSTPIGSWSYDVEVVGSTLVGWFREGQVWGISGATGEVVWRVSEADLAGPVFGEDHLFTSRVDEVLTVEAMSPQEAPGTSTVWSMQVPSAKTLLGVEPQGGGGGRTLGATLDTFFLFDRKTGVVEWTLQIDLAGADGPWSNVTSNRDAVFLYFERQGKPGMMRRIPTNLGSR